MIDIKMYLDTCPDLAGYTVDKLGPGLGVGVFPQGVVRITRDILGTVKLTKRYVLKRRGLRGESWADRVTNWALMMGLRVSGGKLTTPATEGVGVYELTLETEFEL